MTPLARLGGELAICRFGDTPFLAVIRLDAEGRVVAALALTAAELEELVDLVRLAQVGLDGPLGAHAGGGAAQ